MHKRLEQTMDYQGFIKMVRVAMYLFCIAGITIQASAQQFGGSTPQSALVFRPGIMTTLAGNGISGHTGDGGPATSAELTNGIRGIAADAAGDVFFEDDTNDTVRVVYGGGTTAAQLITAENPSVTTPQVGYIYVLAGGEGVSGTPSNGVLGTNARLKPGAALAIDAAGDVFFSDTGTNKVWIIYAGGSRTSGTNLISLEAAVTTPQLGYIYAVAGGSSTLGYAGSGVLATSSGVEFHGINDVKFDAGGDMYIVDQGNCAIREVSASNGYINTVVGNGTCAVQANNGPAISTELDQPYGIAIDANGNLYIADKGTVNEIRMVYAGGATAAALITLENPSIANPTIGYIYNVAGGGHTAYPFGGLATSAKLSGPTMVALDAAGDIYINDNSLVDQVNPVSGVMTVIAGSSILGYAGDGGSALSAQMNGTRCLAVDAEGRIYITDATNLRVREVSQGIVVFSGQAANTTSPPQTIQLSNNGNAELDFTGGLPVFGGTNASDFALALSSPSNTCNLNPLQPGGSCILAVTYTPSGSGASTATLSYTTNGVLSPQQITLQGLVLPATSTTLQSSSQSVVLGSAVTFTATVAGVSNPSGTVNFSNGGTVVGTGTLSSGAAILHYTATTTGYLSITATYSGNANTAGSTSNAVSVNVTGSATSSTVLMPSAASINQGQGVTLMATVNGTGSAPTGSVLFTDGSITLGTVSLNASAVATLTTTALPIGPNSIQAFYFGDSAYAASSSVATVQVYGVPSITLSDSSSVISQGSTETLSVTVAGNGATPTGSVTFYGGSTVLGTGTLTSGVATLSTTTLPGGANNITAAYSGDGNYSAGTSNPVNVTINIASVAFVHPGGWLSASDISRIRTAVANQTAPYYAAYLALPSSPTTTFMPNPGPEATVGAVNNSTYSHLQSDTASAWLLAVRWVATGNQAYATTLCNAIDGWSATLTTIDGTDAALRSGILGGYLAQSAEICSYANPAWPNKARAQNMIRLFAQGAHNFAQSAVPNGNWETFSAAGIMEMAVFLDDRELYNRAVDYFLFGAGNGRITHYVINPAGQVQESGRDQIHTIDGIGSTAEGSLVAWHQGLDLFGAYDDRLVAGFEYAASYLQGATPPFVPNRDAWDNPLNSYFTLSNASTIATVGGPWEMVYNHYANLQGLAIPNTASIVNASGYRPEPNTYSDSGPGTLLYTRSPGDQDPVTSAPVTPIILSSYGTSSGILLRWVGSVGANSYKIQRSSTSGGPYSPLATVSGESTYSYTDTSASGAGTAYYYIVTALNSYGESAPGAEARASVGLPAPWANVDLGTLGLDGAGGSDYLGASTFTLRASGAVVGNSAATVYYNESNTASFAIARAVTPMTDSMQFAYVPLNGDGQIVARVNAPLSPVTSSAGLMMRSSLNSDDAMIASMVQYNGLAFSSSRTAPGVTAITTGPVSISTAATAPPDSSSLLVAPYWVMLSRAGSSFTASVSADNVNWIVVSQQTLSMPTTIYAGLALASGNTTLPTTATFDEVSAPGWTQAATVPTAPANLTAVPAKGIQLTWDAPVGATSFTIQRNGVNMGSVPAPVAGLYASLPGTMYFVDYTSTASSINTYAVSATGAGGTGPFSAAVSAVAPAVTAPFLPDSVGIPYIVGTVGIPLTYQVGLAGSGTFSAAGLPSGLAIDPNTGIISGTPALGGSFHPVITITNSAGLDSWTYTVTIVGAPLPAGMQQVDLGFLQAPGIAGTSGNTIVSTGTGPGTGTVCDVMHFAYYQLTGDGSIVVNLNSVTTASSTTTLSETGIMMRNTLTCDSQMIEARSGVGGSTTLVSAYRAAPNAGAFDYLNNKVMASANVTLPSYLQITRSGNTFTSSYSTDGSTWNAITSQTIGMNPTVYVGLDVAPVDSGVSNTSTGTYSNLAITSASPSLINSPSSANGTVGVPFSFTITSAVLPATYSATVLPSGLSFNSSTGVISGTPTSAGTYAVTVSATNGVASGSASLLITIGEPVPSVVASLSSTSFSAGNPPIASVLVSCNSACGQADFRIDGNEWGTVPLDANGSFTTGSIPSQSVGSHTLQIFYLGNPTYAATASNVISFTVVANGETVPSVVASLSSTSFSAGNPPIASVQVSCNSACGQADFRIDGNEWGTVPLAANGSFITGSIPSQSVGSHTLQIFYLGNPAYAATASNVVNFTVVANGAATPSVVASLTSTSFSAGSPPIASVQVSCNSACGLADFRIDGNEWGTVPLNASGSFITGAVPTQSVGSHTLQIFYLGNPTYAAAASNVVSFTVVANGATTPSVVASLGSTSFSASSPPIASVQVSCNSACGQADFRIDGNEWGTVPLDANGSFITGSIPSQSVGNHTLQIFYLGNPTYAAAASNAVNFTVSP
jgi:hypothetical protein